MPRDEKQALVRLQEIEAEIARILHHFPHLRPAKPLKKKKRTTPTAEKRAR